jgi:tellurite methyltransferase
VGVNWIALFLLASTALAKPVNRSPNYTIYEAVTGESADEDRSFWDSFYKQKDHAFGKEAIGFLKDNLGKIPRGKAFVPAMGEGRNALYLAKNGFEVTGNDISDIAIDKAKVAAKKLNLKLKASVMDLKEFDFPEGQYDFILLSLFFDRALLPNLKKSLKKGGYLMIYEEIYNGDPKNAPSMFWVRSNELPQLLKDFQIITHREYDDHGKRVVGILGKK